jgi:hypothetical protein
MKLRGGQGAEPSLAIGTSPTASRGDMYAAAKATHYGETFVHVANQTGGSALTPPAAGATPIP